MKNKPMFFVFFELLSITMREIFQNISDLLRIFEFCWVSTLLSCLNCCYSYISTLLYYVLIRFRCKHNNLVVQSWTCFQLARLFLPNCYLGISLYSYFKLKLLFKGSLNVFSIRLIHARSIKIRTLVYILKYLFLSRWN